MTEIDFDTDLRKRAARQASYGNYWAGKCLGLLDKITDLEIKLMEAEQLAAECERGDHD